jgi:hypothetical protein
MSSKFMDGFEYSVFSKSPYLKEWIPELSYDDLNDAIREAMYSSRNAHLAKVVNREGKVIARFRDMIKTTR